MGLSNRRLAKTDSISFHFALWTHTHWLFDLHAIPGILECQFGGPPSGPVGHLTKPLLKAYQQDPERVRKWVQEDYPIEKGSQADESGDLVCRRIRPSPAITGMRGRPGVKGKRPWCEARGRGYRLNMISAVNRRGRMRFMIEKKGECRCHLPLFGSPDGGKQDPRVSDLGWASGAQIQEGNGKR